MAKKKSRRSKRGKAEPVRPDLSRRERQIMDILHRGRATAGEVHARMPDDTTYDSVRVTLRGLEKKGHTNHRVDGTSHVYYPTVTRSKARKQALDRLLEVFFPEEPGKAVLSLLDNSAAHLRDEDLDEIQRWIEQAKREDESS